MAVDNTIKLKNFRLSDKAIKKLEKASTRLRVPQVRIVEELISRYADTLKVEFHS